MAQSSLLFFAHMYLISQIFLLKGNVFEKFKNIPGLPPGFAQHPQYGLVPIIALYDEETLQKLRRAQDDDDDYCECEEANY